MSIDDLLEKSYWIMDILPQQVPANGGGQYFKVEQYYLKRISDLCHKYVQILLKLNCYYDIEVSHHGDDWLLNPKPETIEQWVSACLSDEPSESSLFVSLKDRTILLVLGRESTYMTIYNPTEELLTLLCQLASSEGLFLWEPTNKC